MCRCRVTAMLRGMGLFTAMKHIASLFAVAALAGTAAAQPAPPASDQPPAEPPPASDPAAPPVTEPPPATAPVEPPPVDPAQAEKDKEKADKEAKEKKKIGVAGYDKGFFLKSSDDKYTMKINGRVQPFFVSRTATDPIDFRNAFEIRRARLTLEGNIHSKSLAYKFQTDFGRGFVTLKDYYIDAEFAKDTWVRAGQWKRPFSRQQITSTGRLEITDRSITDRLFLGSRDIGVAIHNQYEKSPDFEYIVGVFNGTGDTARFTPTTDPMTGNVTGGSFSNVPGKLRPVWIARAGINRGGIKGYSEADLEGGAARFAIAANIAVEGDNDDDDASLQRAGVDYVVKANGFSTTGGAYVMSSQDGLSLTDQTLAFVGFHVQAGFMATPKVQPVARFAYVDARLENGIDEQEISVGANYYAFGHDVKLTGAVRLFKVGDNGFDDDVRLDLGANIGF